MHDHTHSHEHSHEHSHDQEHHHDHAHEHGHGGEGESKEQMLALMNYMLDHNQGHAQELEGFATKLEAQGQEEAAQLLRDGVAEFGKGNEKLALALEKIKEA